MITVTQVQQENVAAELAKRRKHGTVRTRPAEVSDEQQAATGAHDMARGGADAMAEDAADSGKAYQDRGVTAGPANGLEPGRLGPESADRNYLDAGHASESPQAELPRQNPLPMLTPGYPQSIALSGQTRAAQIPHSVASAYSLGSPSDR